MACLGDASRYRIAQALGPDEVCVTDLARMVGLSQSCTTRHLQALGRDGLVLRRRAGKRVLFRLNIEDPRLSSLLDWAAGGSGQPPGQSRESREPRQRPARAARSGPRGAARVRTPQDPVDDVDPPEPPPDAGARRRGDLEDYLL